MITTKRGDAGDGNWRSGCSALAESMFVLFASDLDRQTRHCSEKKYKRNNTEVNCGNTLVPCEPYYYFWQAVLLLFLRYDLNTPALPKIPLITDTSRDAYAPDIIQEEFTHGIYP